MTTARRIPIRTVQTFIASGASIERQFVSCPVRERSATVEECAACLHSVPGAAGAGFALCGVPDDDPRGAAEWTADRRRVHRLADETLVTDAMTREVVCLHAGDALDAVGALFVAEEIGGAPVVDAAGKPIGVVSKSDLVRDHRDAFAGERTARSVMTAFVATVPETASLSDVVDLMASGIHRVIVVSSTGTVAGIVSTLDVLRWLAKPKERGTIPPPSATVRSRIPAARVSVSSLMGARVVCVEPGVGADQLEAILLDEQISGVPVVEDGGYSVGVVSKTDLVASHKHEHRPALVLDPADDLAALAAPSGIPVNQLMTRSAIGVREQTSVLRAATIMVEQGVHRLPVLTEDGRVIGLLTALDVARWLAARDGLANDALDEPSLARG